MLVLGQVREGELWRCCKSKMQVLEVEEMEEVVEVVEERVWVVLPGGGGSED